MGRRSRSFIHIHELDGLVTMVQTGGRDTAGLGGRGGYMRLFKGHDIKQVSL